MPLEIIEITTMLPCPTRCRLCPQDILKQAYKGDAFLRLDNFKKAISTIPKRVEIMFAGMAEPCLNPEWVNMIEYAYSEGHKIRLYTTLLGATPDDIRKIKPYVSYFKPHLPDNLGNTKIPLTPTYKDTLVTALTELRIDEFSIHNEHFNSNGRAGLVEGARTKPLQGWFNCPNLSNPGFLMLPNCDVLVCCMDYGLTKKVGNLHEQSYMEIVEGTPYKKLKKNRFTMRKGGICRMCTWAYPYYRIPLYKVMRFFHLVRQKQK